MYTKFLIKNQIDLNENDRVLLGFCCQSVRMLIGSVSRTEAECDISCSQSANIF